MQKRGLLTLRAINFKSSLKRHNEFGTPHISRSKIPLKWPSLNPRTSETTSFLFWSYLVVFSKIEVKETVVICIWPEEAISEWQPCRRSTIGGIIRKARPNDTRNKIGVCANLVLQLSWPRTPDHLLCETALSLSMLTGSWKGFSFMNMYHQSFMSTETNPSKLHWKKTLTSQLTTQILSYWVERAEMLVSNVSSRFPNEPEEPPVLNLSYDSMEPIEH